MTKSRYPAIAVHAGEIIKEEIEARGISQKALAESLGVSYTMLNEILNTKRSVSSEFALLIEAALGISAEMLMGIQLRYNLQRARENCTVKRKIAAISRNTVFVTATA